MGLVWWPKASIGRFAKNRASLKFGLALTHLGENLNEKTKRGGASNFLRSQPDSCSEPTGFVGLHSRGLFVLCY
jgi:hypothetical protein